MSKLELENGLRSQILRIIVAVGQATIQIVDSKVSALFYFCTNIIIHID